MASHTIFHTKPLLSRLYLIYGLKSNRLNRFKYRCDYVYDFCWVYTVNILNESIVGTTDKKSKAFR